MSRLPAALFAATFLVPLPASAQSPLGWLDLIRPEFLVQHLAQAGVMALRSQVDLVYGDMALDLRLGQVGFTDVRAWPYPAWDDTGECEIAIDRVTMRSAGLDTPDRIRFKFQASGVAVGGTCLPPDARQPLQMMGLRDIEVPHLTLDIVHHIPTAGTTMQLYADVEDVLVAAMDADFEYFWVDASDDPDDPIPVIFLSSAALTLENKGAWEAMQRQLPPQFTDPGQAGQVVSGIVGQNLARMNRDAAGEGAEGDPSALTEAQKALVDSIAAVLPAFLESPERLVVETGFSPDEATFLDVILYEDNPAQMIEDLQPVLALAPAPARAALPVSLVRGVLDAVSSGATDGVPVEDLQAVGIALLTGQGVPRDRAAGEAILGPLAQAGSGAAANALSEAMEATHPEDAYRYAMVAAAAGEPGATARLDRLESRLSFARVLQIQQEVLGQVSHPVEALESVATIREQALMRLSGRGAHRSYAVAALWAMLGAAAGDAESADILDAIDERVRLSSPEDQAAWIEAEASASKLALEAWLGMDLPARFDGN